MAKNINKQIQDLKTNISYEEIRPDNLEFNNSLHWKITFNNETPVYYSEGIGHFFDITYRLADGGLKRLITELKECITKCADGGASFKTTNKFRPDGSGHISAQLSLRKASGRIFEDKDGIWKITPPKKKDIIRSLTMDSDALQYPFNEWCDNFGYDTDSLKAKGMYDSCQENGFILKSLGFDIEELQKYFQY